MPNRFPFTRRRMLQTMAAALAAPCAMPAGAADPLKIGLILPLTGPFASTGRQIEAACRLYMQRNGDTVAGHKIALVVKDDTGVAPETTKRIAQELVTRDKADILTGFLLTPNAMAAGDISAEAKKFMVVMNAATSAVVTKSPYMVRTSFTVPQLNRTLGTWAAKHGVEKAYTMVTDYGPGHDAEASFKKGLTAAGGNVVGGVRIPVANPDFSAFVQRAKDLKPQGIDRKSVV